MNGLDDKSMGDIGQIYSEAPRPGCQLVLRGFHKHAYVGFSLILLKDDSKEKNSKNLTGT